MLVTGRDWRGGHSTGRAASPGTGTSSSDKKRTTFSVVSAQRRKAFSRKSRYYKVRQCGKGEVFSFKLRYILKKPCPILLIDESIQTKILFVSQRNWELETPRWLRQLRNTGFWIHNIYVFNELLTPQRRFITGVILILTRAGHTSQLLRQSDIAGQRIVSCYIAAKQDAFMTPKGKFFSYLSLSEKVFNILSASCCLKIC